MTKNTALHEYVVQNGRCVFRAISETVRIPPKPRIIQCIFMKHKAGNNFKS